MNGMQPMFNSTPFCGKLSNLLDITLDKGHVFNVTKLLYICVGLREPVLKNTVIGGTDCE
jgi:hypothetical protein